MSQPKALDYLSVIGFSYLEPICTLLEKLENLEPKGPNKVQASPRENGYSVSIIVLSVLLLESAIARTQYVQGQSPPQRPVPFVRNTYPMSGFADRLEELFVVRDVIAHNHIWETKYLWDDELRVKLISANLADGYGDKKFSKVIDKSNRKTRQLSINLYPTRICRNDGILVLKTAVEFLLFLENQDRSFVYISPQCTDFRGELRPFIEIVSNL